MRHGQYATYTIDGCRCDPCTAASTRYTKRWRLARQRGVRFMVDAGPTHRKIQALIALGHTFPIMAAEMGVSPQSVGRILERGMLQTRTAIKYEEMYRRLHMVPAPTGLENRKNRRRALANGWPPPLAWEDIDAGILWEGIRTVKMAPRTRFDLEEVHYVWETRDWSTPLSPIEKAEILRRWRITGRSDNDLGRLTGWKVDRYSKLIPQLETDQEAS